MNIRIFKGAIICTAVAACGGIPPALQAYVSKLPERARPTGAYSQLIPALQGELVVSDSAAACSVALSNGKKEDEDPACICAHSSQDTWQQRCAAWIGGPAASDAGAAHDSSTD